MPAWTHGNLAPYVAHLEALPFVRRVEVRLPPGRRGAPDAAARLRLHTPDGIHELLVEVKRTHITHALANGIVAHWRNVTPGRWILLAPYVGPNLAELLNRHDVNYVDLAGNCRLRIGRRNVALIQGKRPAIRAGQERAMRAAGYQILFALLARPDLLDAPVRALAEEAGVGKTAAADTVRRFEEERLVGRHATGRVLLETGILLDRWLAGYANTLRPRLFAGRFRTNDPDPEALERRFEQALKGLGTWAWGGGVAAYRLTGYFRGETTVLHIAAPPAGLAARLRALPARDGPVHLLKAPGRIAFEGVETGTVHPLLVYTELLTLVEPRAREAAQEIRERYLPWLG